MIAPCDRRFRPSSRLPVYGTLTAIVLTLLWLLHYAWPHIGFDYVYFMPRLLDVHLHYLANGISIQWWTPSFGAGLPAFPNPQHTQFMLAQFLLPLTDPWTAVVLAIVLPISLGFLLVVKFGIEAFEWHTAPAVVAAAIFTTNNFGLNHAFAGHVGYTTFPLLAVLPFCFWARLKTPVALALFSITGAFIVMSGGYTIIVVFWLCALLLAGGLALHDRSAFPPGRTLSIMLGGGILMALMSTAKISAVASFLHHFPRLATYSHPATNFLDLLATIPAQLLLWKPLLFLDRIGLLTADDIFLRWAGAGVEDQGISPVALALIPLGLWYCSKRLLSGGSILLFGALIAAVWLTIEVSLGRGWVWPWIKPLPFVRSLHENCRFTSAFILPLSLLCGIGAQSIFGYLLPTPAKVFAFLFLVGITIASLLPIRRLMPGLWFGNFDVTPTQILWQRIKAGDHFTPVSKISKLNDDLVFAQRASNTGPYEPIFGYGYPGKEFHPSVKLGPIFTNPVSGSLNFHFPSSFYVSDPPQPAPFALIPISEIDNLRDFLARKQPPWPLPQFQSAANGLSWFGIALALGLLTYGATAGPTAPQLQLRSGHSSPKSSKPNG